MQEADIQFATAFKAVIEDDPVRARLTVDLAAYVDKSRSFATHPPQDNETMAHFGIGKQTVDRRVRTMINDRYRTPLRKPLLLTGEIKVTTTFAALLGMCK